MQQETPQQQPALQTPPTPPTPVPPAGSQGGDFYQSAVPAPFAGSPDDHTTSYAAPAHTTAPPETITWEASEYVHTDKGGLWIAGLAFITLAVASVAIYMQAWTFLILVVIMGVAMGVFAFRQPHTLRYTLNSQGVQIGDKTFKYRDFRAFGILEDGAFFTMTLIPVKRFSPALSVYFAEAQGEDIVDIVSAHLPMEHVEPDMIDHIMRRLRF